MPNRVNLSICVSSLGAPALKISRKTPDPGALPNFSLELCFLCFGSLIHTTVIHYFFSLFLRKIVPSDDKTEPPCWRCHFTQEPALLSQGSPPGGWHSSGLHLLLKASLRLCTFCQLMEGWCPGCWPYRCTLRSRCFPRASSQVTRIPRFHSLLLSSNSESVAWGQP